MVQVANGISYVTEDLVLGKHILEVGFPKEMNDQSNQDEDADETLKYTSGNLSQHFLFFYKDMFEKQLETYFKAVVGECSEGEQTEEMMKQMRIHIKHALCSKKLSPELKSLESDHFMNVICEQQGEEV